MSFLVLLSVPAFHCKYHHRKAAALARAGPKKLNSLAIGAAGEVAGLRSATSAAEAAASPHQLWKGRFSHGREPTPGAAAPAAETNDGAGTAWLAPTHTARGVLC